MKVISELARDQPSPGPREHPHRSVFVSGDNALSTTIAEELRGAGADIIKIRADDLVHADFSRASVVICAGDNDAENLGIALLAREANQQVRIIARLANESLRAGLGQEGPDEILDVANLSASSVIEACLSRQAHPFELAGIQFIVSGAEAPRDGTLRDIYADLAPVAVVQGKNSPDPGGLVASPGRDLFVHKGDWTAMIGTTDELAARGIRIPNSTRSIRPWPKRLGDVGRAIRDNANPMFYPSLGLLVLLVVGSIVVARFSFRPSISWVDSFYFTAETISTVGLGDFSFAKQPEWLRIFAVSTMFGGVITTALNVALVGDLLLSSRVFQTAGRRRARHLRDHVVVIGLGSSGFRVVSDLTDAGYDVAVIEIDEDNHYLSDLDEMDVPVIFGDATLRQTLEAANVERARAVAVLTKTDMVNIEVGVMLLDLLGSHQSIDGRLRTQVPLVLRILDQGLGEAVTGQFGFENVRSTVELAAPWFIGAAMGLQVLGTFSVGQRSFMVGGMRVAPDSVLDGLPMDDLSTQVRVLAVTRPDAPVTLHPPRDTRLCGGDTVYLVGPSRELLATLRRGRPPQPLATVPRHVAEAG